MPWICSALFGDQKCALKTDLSKFLACCPYKYNDPPVLKCQFTLHIYHCRRPWGPMMFGPCKKPWSLGKMGREFSQTDHTSIASKSIHGNGYCYHDSDEGKYTMDCWGYFEALVIFTEGSSIIRSKYDVTTSS